MNTSLIKNIISYVRLYLLLHIHKTEIQKKKLIIVETKKPVNWNMVKREEKCDYTSKVMKKKIAVLLSFFIAVR